VRDTGIFVAIQRSY